MSQWIMAILSAAGLMACVPVRPAAPPNPASATSASSAAPAADAQPVADPASADAFQERVLPILQGKCSPCHFPGGKMHERLPFDDPGTIRVLGTGLFTRIRNEEDRAVIRAFLGVGADAPAPPEEP